MTALTDRQLAELIDSLTGGKPPCEQTPEERQAADAWKFAAIAATRNPDTDKRTP